MEEKKRTLKQNRAIHKFFQECADELNNAGIGLKPLIEGLEVEHSFYTIKSIFRAIGKAKFGKSSTADLTTKELQDCFEEFTKMLAYNGIIMSFPSYKDTDEYLKSYEV